MYVWIIVKGAVGGIRGYQVHISQCRAGGGGDIFLRKVASRIENSFRVKGHCHVVIRSC